MTLKEELEQNIQSEVCVDEKVLIENSRDTSIFQIKPQIVVYPKEVSDIQNTIRIIERRKKEGENIALTGRSAGTCMSGGSLTEGVILSCVGHFNKMIQLDEHQATVQPGMFYRDFEAQTLTKGWIMPSYPASRGICAIGGIVMNNSGGEKSLIYGKTERYIKEVEMVLSNGDVATFKELSMEALDERKKMENFEGEIYRKMWDLISSNYDHIKNAKPQVTKNSAGYYLWNVYDKEKNTFDLTKLMVGSQGTLGILSNATITGIKPKKESRLLVVFLQDLKMIAKVTNTLLKHAPETIESYDDKTLEIAVKFFFDIIKHLKGNVFTLAWGFLPEFGMVLTGGMPKLIIMAEFTGDNLDDVNARMKVAHDDMMQYGLKMNMTKDEDETSKYWTLRRESFNLLRSKLHGNRTAPFIDDIVVNPDLLPEFLPKLQELFSHYPLVYTIAGHVGNGNFHIIPLMDLSKDESITIIKELGTKVFDLVKEYKGSITGEHNDGLIRTAFLNKMYDDKTLELFSETKKIFDPHNILNPGKKVNGDWEYAVKHIDRSHDVLEKQTYMPC